MKYVAFITIAAIVTALLCVGCSKKAKETTTSTPSLEIKDIVVGTGATVVNGSTVKVLYTGTFTNGTVFDSVIDRSKPFSFIVGSGQVIKGWEQGVMGMKVGGKRKLTIPPELGYGNKKTGPIPANSTLIFELELLEVK